MASSLELLSKAFHAINKYRMDVETHLKPGNKKKHPIYGMRLDTTDIDLNGLAKLNPEVRASMAYPGQRYSELWLEYTGLLPEHVERVASVHKLRSSFDPYSPITVFLKRRPSAKELKAFEKKASGEGFIVSEIRSRRSLSIGGMPFTDLRHASVYWSNYDLVASVPAEHNALPVFDAEKGAKACALLLDQFRRKFR